VEREPGQLWGKKFALRVEYDGHDFHGWQFQPQQRTVQGALQEALSKILQRPVTTEGAGRTDAGVHARGQVASFVADTNIPPEGLRKGCNTLLPDDVAVTAACQVPPEFSARRSAVGKRYCYRIWTAADRSPLWYRLSWHRRFPLDPARMREAAAHLIGEHDFAAFRAADCDRKTTARTLTRVDVVDPGSGGGGERQPLVIVVEGDAFLKNMVRIIAGTLIEIGHGRRPVESIPKALASGKRTDTGITAPPEGLTLEQVYYDPPIF
jgi:tRNA pseudouridine38-40 synthase